MILRFKMDYRFFHFGQEIEFKKPWYSVSQDEGECGNYYVHGWNDEYPTGYHSNYLVIPKYAAFEVKSLTSALISDSL